MALIFKYMLKNTMIPGYKKPWKQSKKFTSEVAVAANIAESIVEFYGSAHESNYYAEGCITIAN